MIKIKNIILILILILTFLLTITGVGLSADASQEIVNFINDWNENVEHFEKEWSKSNYRSDKIAKELFLKVEDFNELGGKRENYLIDLFEGQSEEIELSISYSPDSNVITILIINEQKGFKDRFVKDNLLAIQAGEVLIHTLKSDKEAKKIVNQLRLYEFWGNSYTDLGLYHDLETDEFGAIYDIWLDEFSAGILFDNDPYGENYFEMGYMGPLI
ncbi:MAG: hypothetical protein ACOCP8_08970 [archaeon]